jgi:uncharacterized protein YpmB
MDIVKKTMVPLIMLLIVVLVWVGFYIYFESSKVDVNPKAQEYTTQLQNSFDLDTLDTVSRKTKDHFPILPEVFFTLVGRE